MPKNLAFGNFDASEEITLPSQEPISKKYSEGLMSIIFPSLIIASLRVGTQGASENAPLRKKSARIIIMREKKRDII